ncbi:MAG: ATP-dependent Clp protease proteolytic subunit [Blastocatellia bacterium]
MADCGDDIKIAAEEILACANWLNENFASQPGKQSIENIERDAERDYIMSDASQGGGDWWWMQ